MTSRTRTALGIDISERRVSAAVVEKSERGFRTVAAATESLPAGGAGRPSEYTRVLSRMFRRLGRHARPRGLRAAVAISVHPMIMQLLEVPKPMPTNLGDFVGQELRQYVALSGRVTQSDYCGTGIAGGPPKRLLAVAADAAQVRETVKACGMSGAAVEAAEPSVLAYARAVLQFERQTGREQETIVAVLDCHSLTMCLFSRGALDFVRVRDIPADAGSADSFCRWLAGELRVVMQYGGTQVVPNHPRRQAQLIVHEATYPLQDVQRLCAAQAGMDAVRVVGPCDCLPEGAAAGENASLRTPAAAFGAALRLLDAEREDARVNLVPAEVTRTRQFLKRVLLAANVAALIFVGVLLVVQHLSRATIMMQQKLDQARVSHQLYTIPALIAQEKFLDREISRIEQALERLQAVRARPAVDWPGVLDTARRVVPAEVSIMHLVCGDGRSLSVKGLAPSCEAAQQFVRSLEGAGPFETVSLARLERQRDPVSPLEYQIDCLLKQTR